jgi:hypothetical protein
VHAAFAIGRIEAGQFFFVFTLIFSLKNLALLNIGFGSVFKQI